MTGRQAQIPATGWMILNCCMWLSCLGCKGRWLALIIINLSLLTQDLIKASHRPLQPRQLSLGCKGRPRSQPSYCNRGLWWRFVIDSVFLTITDTLSRSAPPLTLENVFNAVKSVKSWRKLCCILLQGHLSAFVNATEHQFDSGLKALLESFLLVSTSQHGGVSSMHYTGQMRLLLHVTS